jgi:nicotinamide-nucleotide amidase
LKEVSNYNYLIGISMFAEIITIGDELLIGQVVDTNSAWMGRELNKVGIEVIRVVSVRDRADEITEAVDDAMNRADIVLMTGGLGPTKDDITKQTLCAYFDTELVFSEEVFENIKRVLASKIPMNALNKSQAMVPKDCLVINNRVGSASVSWFEKNGKVLVSMPGVPQEMITVMSEEVIPRLRQKFDTDVIIHKTFTVKNYPESVLAEKLESWEEALPESIKLAYLPKPGIIRLRLTGRGKDKEEVQSQISVEGCKLKYILGDAVFDEEDTPLEILIGNLLREKNLTVSTAESCTGGSIAAKLTSVPGSSDYFKGGIVAYSNEIKESLLGVSSETLKKQGAVSEETVIEMVKGAMKALKTDCAVSTSGIAGPGGGTKEKPVGTVWIAAAYKNEIRTMKQDTDRGREMNVERAGNNAFLLLLDLLK